MFSCYYLRWHLLNEGINKFLKLDTLLLACGIIDRKITKGLWVVDTQQNQHKGPANALPHDTTECQW